MSLQELSIVHVEDVKLLHEEFVATCERDLHIPESQIHWRKSKEGALDLFRELALLRHQIHAVVCNGEIRLKEEDPEPLLRNGGLQVFAEYQDMTDTSCNRIRECIGMPLWIHHTGSLDIPITMKRWNQSDPHNDLSAGVFKIQDDRALSITLAIALHVRGTLPENDHRVQWALQQVRESHALPLEHDDKILIDFSAHIHERMRANAQYGWPKE